ncbi:MoaD/ThiS family protein [Solwaraspora sp. WMMD406]|uniref:MoaD/ThiS family protein n=1 Tax=Solwaraspora sp. WMMD406 TaxID=3016095 RepID=UPI002416F17D|nr:MoaD/ThiS family protein [Solwaraspora sp. WMMD406]MDG4763104.1 MoaD/ThiS family protein [Solwaraspora sp. WMMD406]
MATGDRPTGAGDTRTAAGDTITVRYFAGARAAAGRAEETLGAGLDHAAFVAELADRHGERLARVLAVAGFLVDGTTWQDRQTPLPPGVTVDVLPPFAGG